MIRHQLPAYSPLSGRAVLRGLGAAVRRGGSGRRSDAGGTAPALNPPSDADASSGDPRARLRRHLLRRFEADDALLVDSGTSALRKALELARKEGRVPVALPAYTCYDVATAAVGADVPVVFYDLDPATLAPDGESLAAALQRGAGSVVVSPLLGYPVDWDAVRRVCARHDALLVEDVAQAVGSSWRGRAAGTFGDLTVLSFGRGKGWTGGGGGALLNRRGRGDEGSDSGEEGQGHPNGFPTGVPNDLPAPGPVRELRIVVTTAAQHLLGRPALFGIPSSLPFLSLGETHYRPPGPVAAMAAASAAVALANEADLEGEQRRREENASYYWRRLGQLGTRAGQIGTPPGQGGGLRGSDGALEEVGVLPVQILEEGEPSWLRFGVRVEGGVATLAELGPAERLGLRQSYPRPLYRLPALESLQAGAVRRLPGAESLAASLVTIPTHSLTTEAERAAVAELLVRASR